MSCCAEKTGLARLAEDPAIILVAYICALVPLAAIYALDFITERWKTIQDTRRLGKVHLAFSLPPLAAVIFYIHLQKLAEDYKEMATAITAAILCILHVLRTLWGLAQLRAFKQWNMHALHVLARLGVDYPVYIPRRELPKWSTVFGSIPEPTSKQKNGTLGTQIFVFFSPLLERTKRVFGFEDLCKFASRKSAIRCREIRDEPSAKEIERTVDCHMIVNSSLVDNEFFGAELPCTLNVSLPFNHVPKSELSISHFISCAMPKECAVRWAVSFLARFGSEWLIHMKLLNKPQLALEDASENILNETDLQNRLSAFITFIVTRTVNYRSIEGIVSSQQVSTFSPLHVMCSDLLAPWVPTLKVTRKNALPYQMRCGRVNADVNFEEHAVSIRNVVSSWHKESLNELDEEEKTAVLSISPHQLACFSKTTEERNPHMIPIFQDNVAYDHRRIDKQRFNTFLWQLGYDTEPFGERSNSKGEGPSAFFEAMPMLRPSLRPCLSCDKPMSTECAVLQASVHVDNWIALEDGEMTWTYREAQQEVSPTDAKEYGHVFCAQKRLELKRLQLELSKMGPDARAVRKIKFMGCLAESVRSSLAYWLQSRPHSSRDTPSPCDWITPIVPESVQVHCSDQLNDALREAHSFQEEAENSTRLKCLHMRILWETQLSLLTDDRKHPGSTSLIILFLLGYPSLRVSKVKRCPRNLQSNSNRNRSVVVNVDSSNNVDVAESRSFWSSAHDNYSTKSCDRKYSCYKIDIVEGPQPLHVMFLWNSVDQKANVQICSNEGPLETRFCWQNWKDAFMGRICAQAEWRSKRLHIKNEQIRIDAAFSKITEGLSEPSEEDSGMTYWWGWPPFRTEITGFEKQVSNLYIGSLADLEFELDRVSGIKLEEVSVESESEVEIEDVPESDCDCGCEEHGMFFRAKEFLENGQEGKARELFIHCFTLHRHSLALEHYISNVCNNLQKDEEIEELLSMMYICIESTIEDSEENECRAFQRFGVQELAHFFDDIYEATSYCRALFFKGVALFILSIQEDAALEQCIEAFESYVLFKDEFLLSPNVSNFCLALCFLRRYRSKGYTSDRELGLQHIQRICENQYFPQVREFCLDIAIIYEKGLLSRREYGRLPVLRQRFSALLPQGTDLDYLLQKIFLRSNNTKDRVFKDDRIALRMYSVVTEKYLSDTTTRRVFNRLGLMYYKGSDDIPKDLDKAKTMYTRAIESRSMYCKTPEDAHSINAMCNLAVWYGPENPQECLHFLSQAIDEFDQRRKLLEEKEQLDQMLQKPLSNHSVSMNNMAVLVESGMGMEKNIDKAKQLYLRSVEIDQNPVAMYNLALLLRLTGATTENLERAENLLCAVAALGPDLFSLPRLQTQMSKVRVLPVAETTGTLPFDVEEIDDCLAYVKLVDTASRSSSDRF